MPDSVTMTTHLKLRTLLGLMLAVLPWQQAAAFSSLYVFGDGVCTTTDNPSSTRYHGNRYCNGRVWVEVLAQWQGLAFDNAKNKSFFGHDSIALVNGSLSTSVNNFAPPVDVATALVVVWCNDADFVKFTQVAPSPPYTSSQIPQWTVLINDAITRQVQALNTLYNKGVRTILMPKAANISATPYYANFGNNPTQIASNKQFIRQRTIEFNIAFDNAINGFLASKPALTIHRLDTFTFFEQVLATPAAYGLTNTTVDAISAFPTSTGETFFKGAASSYVFWDLWHPTAKFQMYLADLAQRAISPVKVSGITRSGNVSQITVSNVPLSLNGVSPLSSPRNGFVEGSATLQTWAQDATINQPFSVGGSTTKTVSVTSPGTCRFFRVSFPVVWTWP